MRLLSDECWTRLQAADHGVLCTMGADRKIDAVPVCFAVVSHLLITPIDRVKPKATTDLGPAQEPRPGCLGNVPL